MARKKPARNTKHTDSKISDSINSDATNNAPDNSAHGGSQPTEDQHISPSNMSPAGPSGTPGTQAGAEAPCSDSLLESSSTTTGKSTYGELPIVGIGASAGGLEALKKLFNSMPSESGMAFVLVPHLDPSHQSLMAELLGKQTDMPVEEVVDQTQVLADHVYVIPPNQRLTINGGLLHLSPSTGERGIYSVIDTFLCSLAADQQQRAIAIVLSGTGQHGLQGLREIKAAGGMVIAQDPGSAAHPAMPSAAIDAGVVDYVLPPEEMPELLVRYTQHTYVKSPESITTVEARTEHINSILALLRTHTKYDFRSYRKKMLMRRVARRMGLSNIPELTQYIELLRQQPEETRRLFKDLLIGVTEFFREPEAFEFLSQQALPELIARADADTALRVWVPGCASGEEAYSIAMLIIERFSAAGRDVHLQIFATDIDEESLNTARRGVYSEIALHNVSTERRRRFFVKSSDGQFQVSKQLRESVVFAPQNLISDAPFSKLDLVSCRNLLIYLEPDVQARVIAMFHFALNPGGILVLGPSETIGRATDRFEPLSPKWRVYRRIGSRTPGQVDFPIFPNAGRQFTADMASRPAFESLTDLDRLTERLLLRNAPAAVLVNRRHEILNYHGPTRRYLENPSGPPTRDLIDLALEGLRTKLRAAVLQAARESKLVVVEDARVKRDGSYYPVKFTVEPVRDSKDTDGLLLVTFEEQDEIATGANEQTAGPLGGADTRGELAISAANQESAVISQLESELKATRDDLQSTIEEQESANEELKAANEEVMSMNEELQSTNEELESSKEELQSLNEELNTVNNQLEEKLASWSWRMA